ncbi:MAG TPA: PhzF family phenazine biosynthesis protein [Gaiellaceae bacterium]|nr:PhzF family phenazine biosynthesis protein [Gaiellaceae bacterium]
MPTLRYVVVDVFTDTALTGNQLAVFTDAREIDTELMQALAREVNYSETTFVLSAEQRGTARIRIFNPNEEMCFAGHPVLGSAWVLAQPLQRGVVELETGVGVVPVEIERDESGALVFGRMEQPVPTIRSVADIEAVLATLGVGASEVPVELYDNGATHIVVTLENEDAVAALSPDPSAIAAFGVTGVNCIAGSGSRWKNRMFWPLGEDAATGSAAGPIACHLSRDGLVEWGEWIEISQGVEIGRPSTLFARADSAGGEVVRVFCGGRAVVVARGEFRL